MMKIFSFVIDINCTLSSWANDNPKKPIYRFYFNNDLLTERTWIWDENTYIQEEIAVVLDVAQEHTIKLETILSDPTQASFTISNLNAVNDFHTEIINQIPTQITFRIV